MTIGREIGVEGMAVTRVNGQVNNGAFARLLHVFPPHEFFPADNSEMVAGIADLGDGLV